MILNTLFIYIQGRNNAHQALGDGQMTYLYVKETLWNCLKLILYNRKAKQEIQEILLLNVHLLQYEVEPEVIVLPFFIVYNTFLFFL